MSNRYPDNLELNENSRFAVVGSVVNGGFIVLLADSELKEYEGTEHERKGFIEDLKLGGFEVREMDGQILALVTDMVLGEYGDIPLVS